jgi:hypothetical protein
MANLWKAGLRHSMIKEMFIGTAIREAAYSKDFTWTAIKVSEGGGGGGGGGFTFPWQWIGLGIGAIVALVIARRGKFRK